MSMHTSTVCTTMTALVLLTCMPPECTGDSFTKSVCDIGNLTFNRPSTTDRYFVQSPDYDGHTDYKPNTECEKMLFIETGAVCCRLHALHFDMDFSTNANQEFDYLQVHVRDANGVYRLFYDYNEVNVNASIVALMPSTQYYFKYKTDTQVNGKGFRLEVKCTDCAQDELEGKELCVDGAHITYNITAAFADGKERYIRSPAFNWAGNATYQSNASECTVTIDIADAVCCNMVQVDPAAGAATISVSSERLDFKNKDVSSDIKPKVFSYTDKRADHVLVGGSSHRMQYTKGGNLHEFQSRFQFRLMCIWCEASRNRLPPVPEPTPDRSAVNSGSNATSGGNDVLVIVLSVAGALVLLLIIIGVIVYIVRIRNRLRKHEQEQMCPEMLMPTADFFSGDQTTTEFHAGSRTQPVPDETTSITYIPPAEGTLDK